MPHFYATSEDLIPVIEKVESKLSLKYARCGHFESADIHFYFSGLDLPTLGKPLAHESAVSDPAYLVSHRDTAIQTRELSEFKGRPRFAVDQAYNEHTTVLWHGGLYGSRILLHGRVDTISQSKQAQQIQRAFGSALRKYFARIRAFYVGPQAEHLLDSGYRLTAAEQSPPDYDLRRP